MKPWHSLQIYRNEVLQNTVIKHTEQALGKLLLIFLLTDGVCINDGYHSTKMFLRDHSFVSLLFQADYQRRFQEIVFGDIRNADISKISSLLKQGVDPNIYNQVGLENSITTLLV